MPSAGHRTSYLNGNVAYSMVLREPLPISLYQTGYGIIAGDRSLRTNTYELEVLAVADVTCATHRSNLNQCGIGLAHFGPKQRVIHPAFWLVHGEVGWHHIVVAAQNFAVARLQQRAGIFVQALYPGQLVVKFWARGGMPLGYRDSRLSSRPPPPYVAALHIVRIAGQAATEFDRICASSEDGDTVPALCPCQMAP